MQKTIPRIKTSEKRDIKYDELIMNESSGLQPMKDLLITEIGVDATKLIGNFISLYEDTTFFTSTITRFNIDKLPSENYTNIVNLAKINDIRWVNKFFESVNKKIPYDGYFIGIAETYQLRNKHLYERYPIVIGFFVVQLNFLLRRVIPKLPLLKRLYFYFTKGNGRAISKAETLGRLISCGFKIIEYKEINNLLFFITQKVKEPAFDLNPSYGPLFKMKRIGKDGKIFSVYKIRTMHPYSEYLQKYMIERNGYDKEGKGKLKNDYRVTVYGKIFRKFWIDEIPQIINVFKGEMNIVGVRPLSQTRYDEFPDEFRKQRNKYKPGCFPPYVALLMPDENDNIEAEKIYFKLKEKHPYWTDVKFFWLSIYNILTNKIRGA